ncbi:hypothetical protein [Candidatus Liberibacter americanus]|uniref:Uncharacterized protein n=1 Tax=Candidatus Liberibacter americanus str. Sao Paulo TaxID=1261131 RepID=U6B7P2_9HYPH|nr:hypothetical protein [Candidatus Liberibacter americanus]AHA27881.1 hypothetical protein lam_528 [Candidatus Liberibacter americanus str. Sao Paulo]EMS36122.1 hypothetical protein G653_03381 [Candidatus Liberibacter americanus PW_SP]
MSYDKKIEDSLKKDIVKNIHIRIQNISRILLSEGSNAISENEIRELMYIVAAKMIALAALREGKKSRILHIFSKNKKKISQLTKITINEINLLRKQ